MVFPAYGTPPTVFICNTSINSHIIVMISSVDGSTIITRSYSTQHALLPTKPSKRSPPALPTIPLQEAHIFFYFLIMFFSPQILVEISGLSTE